jgi:hypothetical protein
VLELGGVLMTAAEHLFETEMVRRLGEQPEANASRMTVAERLHELRLAEREIRAALCTACGHPYSEHWNHGACWHPLVRALSDDRPCRCRLFVDPAVGAVEGEG